MYVTYEKIDTGQHSVRVWTYDVPFRLYGSECQWIIPGTVGVDD